MTVATTRRRRRPWLWIGAAGVIVMIAAAWTLPPFTGIGFPADPYSSTPEPCELLPRETVRELVGSVPGERIDPVGASGWRPSVRRETQLWCAWQTEQILTPLEVRVQRSVSSQFGLGPTGAEKAATVFETVRNRGCDYQLATDDGQVCAQIRGYRLSPLTVLHENLLIEVYLRPDLSDTFPWDPAEKAAQLTDEVLSQLHQGERA